MAVAPVPGIKDRYSYGELARLVIWAGFRGTNAAIAVAVIMAESGGRRLARHVVGPEGGRAQGSVDRGLMQINSYYHSDVSNKCAYNPYCNVRQGYRIAGGGRNFRPWSTYNSGAYKRFFASAAEAVAGSPGAGATGLPGPPPPPTSKPPSLHDAIRRAIDNVPGVPGFLARILADVLEPPIQFAMDIAHLASNTVGKLLHTAIIHVKWAIDALRHQAAGIVRWAGRQFVRFKHWVEYLYNKILRWIATVAKDTLKWVNVHVWKPLKSALDGLGHWIRTTVIPWAKRLIDGLAHWARKAVDFLTGLISRVWNWARDAVGRVIRWVRTAVEWVGHFGAVLATFAVRALSWIQIMVRWPYTALLGLWRDLAVKAPRVILQVTLAAVRDNANTVEDLLLRLFLGK